MLLVIGPDNQTGFRKHLEELTCVFDYPSKFIAVKERGSKKTLKEISKYQPNLTIIGARNWIKRNKGILDKIPGKKGLLFIGSLGQNEISQDIKNLYTYMELLDSKKIDFLFVGSREFVDLLNRKEVIYLPAPYTEKLITFNKKMPKKRIVSMLSDKAVHKNILNGIAGIAKAKNVEEFVINGVGKEYLDLIKRFGLKAVFRDVGFLSKYTYYKQIESSKLLVNVSYTEGFCYGILEAFVRGTPVIITNSTPWFYHPLLYIKNPADYEEIAKKIDNILSMDDKKYKRLSKDCMSIAKRNILEDNEICSGVLNKLLKK